MSSTPPESSQNAAPDSQPDAHAIMAVLTSRLDLDVTEIALDVDEGRVVVTGTLSLRRMVHQIQSLIEAQPGVASVDMRVEVVQRNVAEADRRQQQDYRQDSTGMISDERDRQTGHEI
jgi:hypothetical protein